jgi:putative glycosyltransferase (TIGR04348 family)
MRILLVCPAPPRTRGGNRITAERWARLLRRLGHRVAIRARWDGARCDLLVALHARKSGAAALAFRARRATAPLVVALTGTDLYRDLRRSRRAERALTAATRLVVLQPAALAALPRRLRAKARVIHQSAPRLRGRAATGSFDVCVVGHLRPEKDPFRAAAASRRLPAASRIRVLHVGRALSAGARRRARAEAARDPRYRWLGERPHRAARLLLARSRLLVLSSRMEGGANVISEALASDVPVLASRIPGSVGLLGPRYPGYFPTGDTAALARLLHRAEADPRFYARLRDACRRRAHLASPQRELRAWRALVRELVGAGPAGGGRRRRRV